MKITVHTFVTLDGVLQGPGGPEEDTSGGFDRGGWLVPHVDEDFGRIVSGWFAEADAFLLGRGTFDLFAGYWPQVDDPDDDVATALNGLPKYVVSGTLADPSWSGTTVLAGDPLAAIAGLKQRPGRELQVHGSWRLIQALHGTGLVDEYRVLVFPVVVGGGKRLFEAGTAAATFDLLHTERTGAGVQYQVLRPGRFRSGGHAVVDGQDTCQETT